MTVVIGIPTPPENTANANTIAIAAAWERDNGCKLITKPTPSPEEGRDKIVSDCRYMVPNPTHILFIDADVVPRRNTLRALTELDKDVVCGVVPIFQRDNFYWNVSRDDKFTPYEIQELPRDPFKVALCGFGVVLVKFDVFERIDWPYWRGIYEPGLRTEGDVWC